MNQTVSFIGARDELHPEQPGTPQVYTTRPVDDGKAQIIKFPLSYAIECNKAKTDCKHAVVKTQLEFIAQPLGAQSVKLSGTLNSEMGRSLTVASQPSSMYFQKQSMSVPDEVAVISESKNDLPIEKVLPLGEKLELEGLGGVRVIVEFQR